MVAVSQVKFMELTLNGGKLKKMELQSAAVLRK